MAQASRRVLLRGQMPAADRATQTEHLTKRTMGDDFIPKEVGATMSKRGKTNKAAVRPGMYAPGGPQPFIAKGVIKNPGAELPDALSSDQLQQHATSSSNSFGVSFTMVGTRQSAGYQAQLSWSSQKAAKKDYRGKSFLTTTSEDLMQENPHSSGNENEYIGMGHKHRTDANMMQHFISKTDSGFAVKSRKWTPQTADHAGGWGAYGDTKNFDSFSDAFERMITRGEHGRTHFDE